MFRTLSYGQTFSLRSKTNELIDEEAADGCVKTGGQKMEAGIDRVPGESQREENEIGGSRHTHTHGGILNYHCIPFLSDLITSQPQNNYIQRTHSKRQMKCNRRSETL